MLRPVALALLLLLSALSWAPPAQAQDPAAPHLSPAANKLYAHHHDSDTAELNGWMNTHVVDPTGNDVALGPQTTCCPQARVHAFTLTPALAGDVELDPAGNIVFEAYIGAGSSQGAVRVSTELRHGGELVAAGAAQNHVYQQAGTAAYPKLTWTVAPEITSLEQGKDLVWTISITGVAVQTVFVSVSPERGSTNIALPVLSTTATGGGANAPQLHNLTGDAPAFNVTAAAPTNATHVYAWTGPATPVRLSLDGDRRAGNATLVVRDGANATLSTHAFNGSATLDLVGQAGNWTFTLALQGFQGNLTAKVDDVPAGSSGTGTSTRSSTATGTRSSGSATSSGDGGNATKEGGDKGAPAPAVPVVLGALAVAVALGRRRLR